MSCVVKVCTKIIFLRSIRMTNRCARNTEWGDLLPVKLSASSKIEPEEDSLVAEESHLDNEKSAKTIKDE